MMHNADSSAAVAATNTGTGSHMKPDDTMTAIVQDVYGSADVLRTAEIDVPSVANDEVLVRVHAAGLDRGTWHLMAGMPYVIRLGYGFRGPKNPVPGLDVAGTVEAIGSDVTRFAVGDEVFGIANGSFAQYTAAKESKLAHKPASLTFDQAAAVAVSGVTAIQGLRDKAQVKPGQHVLIVGASGGVGTYAVQIAKSLGAEVTGVSSAAKAGMVRAIGADHVIDYTTEDFGDGSQQYDAIIDIGGNSPLKKLRGALTASGTLVIVGGEEGGKWIAGVDRQLRALALSPFISQRLTTFMASESYVDMERLAELIDAGELVPVIDTTYSLDEVPEAMRQLEAGQVKGKVVISVESAG